MIKAIVLLSKLPHLTRDEFIDYYETRHVFLVRRLLPMIGKYVRNYLDFGDTPHAHDGVPAQPPGFDVLTEIWFADDSAYADFITTIGRPEIAFEIAADEAHFIASKHNRVFRVAEFESPL